MARRLSIPQWSALRSLGELRLLRLSYLLLVAIPALQMAFAAWNTLPDRQWEEWNSKQSVFLLNLRESMRQVNEKQSNIGSRLSQWIDDAERINSTYELGKSVDAAEALAQSLPTTLTPLMRDWINLAKKQQRWPTIPRFDIGWELRLIYLAMVCIAVAHLLYAVFCPAQLRVVHQPLRQGEPSGLGDRLDWVLSLYDRCVANRFSNAPPGSDEPEQRRTLVAELMDPDEDDRLKGIKSGTNTRTWAIAVWNSLQNSKPPIRGMCGFLYLVGLALVAVVLCWKIWEILHV